jgi:hypothetical protein
VFPVAVCAGLGSALDVALLFVAARVPVPQPAQTLAVTRPVAG